MKPLFPVLAALAIGLVVQQSPDRVDALEKRVAVLEKWQRSIQDDPRQIVRRPARESWFQVERFTLSNWQTFQTRGGKLDARQAVVHIGLMDHRQPIRSAEGSIGIYNDLGQHLEGYQFRIEQAAPGTSFGHDDESHTDWLWKFAKGQGKDWFKAVKTDDLDIRLFVKSVQLPDGSEITFPR